MDCLYCIAGLQVAGGCWLALVGWDQLGSRLEHRLHEEPGKMQQRRTEKRRFKP